MLSTLGMSGATSPPPCSWSSRRWCLWDYWVRAVGDVVVLTARTPLKGLAFQRPSLTIVPG